MAKLREFYGNLSKTTKKNSNTLIGFVLAFIILYFLDNGQMLDYVVSGQLVPILYYILMSLSLNLTVGVMGDLSLGHAGFVCVGAYTGLTASVLLTNLGMPQFWVLFIAILVGAIFSALCGLLVGIPSLRLKGDYLAIVTLAFCQIIKTIFDYTYIGYNKKGLVFTFSSGTIPSFSEDTTLIVRGPQGALNIPQLTNFTSAFVVVLICLILIFNLMRSRTGRYCMASRDNDIASQSIGINVRFYKLLMFTISSAIAGVAGVLYVHSANSIRFSVFDYNFSIQILVFVVLGGLGNMRGSIISTTILVILPEILRELNFDKYRMLCYAILLIVITIIRNNDKFKYFMKNFKKNLASKFKFKKGGKENV